jgi:nitrile hydratase subunit beta
MNGIHDMGGLHGFGPVQIERDEPVFHSRWESRVYAMVQAIDASGIWNLDEHRHEIELMDPAAYLTDGYYGRWLFATEHLLSRKGVLHRAEVDLRVQEINSDTLHPTPADPAGRNWPLADQDKVRWGAWRHEVQVSPIFNLGDRVRVRTLHPEGHTRVTAYTRGRVGTVHMINAQAWVLPDTRARNTGENLQPVYNVRFAATELWGPQAEPNTWMHIDLSQYHLEPAEPHL